MVGGEKRQRDKWANPSLADPICRCVIQPNMTQYAGYKNLEKQKDLCVICKNYKKLY